MHTANPVERPAGTLAIAVLGADAMLAALPATPVQIAHACLAAGYAVAVPASWGDELLAAECLRQLDERGARPAVMCACPLVRSDLLAVGPDLAPVLIALVPPPVAVARYLHAHYGRDRMHLTYIGSCPGAADESIDAAVSPDEFFASLTARGISVTDQPQVFDSVIPPDRRRFYSIAGGVPSAEQLWSIGNGRSLVELDGEDYLIDLAQHLLSHECALIDLAPRLGCACSGASGTIPARSARAAVAVIEPPRAASAVIDVGVAVDLRRPIESTMVPPDVGHVQHAPRDRSASPHDAAPSNPAAAELHNPGDAAAARAGRYRSPAAGVRALQSTVPTTRIAGRSLPRAYMASRRQHPVSMQEPPAASHVTPRPAPPSPDGGTEDPGRPRAAARVAAAPRARDDRPAPASIAAGAAGAPEKMSDGPRG